MILSLDCETSGLHPDSGANVVLLAVAWRKQGLLQSRAWATPWATGEDWPGCTSEKWRQIVYWIAKVRHCLVSHNAKFDLLHLHYATRGILFRHPAPATPEQWLRSGGETLMERTIWDTMLAQKVMEGFASAGLKETARRLWGDGSAASADELEKWFIDHRQKSQPRYDQVPWELISRYARQDVELTLRLYEWQLDVLEETGDSKAERLIVRELELMKLLLRMELRGVQFDAAASLDAAGKVRAEMQRLEGQLPFRTTLPAAKAYFFGELGLKPQNLTKNGAPQLTERDVDELTKQNPSPSVRYFARHQALKSANSKWYAAWPSLVGEDGRLRTVFNQTNVRSTRLAVSRAQLQAIPHERHFRELGLEVLGVPQPRELFQAKKGHELWEIDLSQGEVRIAAAVASCSAMREIVSTPGADVHGETCKRVFGIDESDPDWKARRDIAKRITFGTLYGAGARTLAATIHKETGIVVGENEMRDMIDMYKETFPEFFSFAREAERQCQHNGFITLVSGKKRYFKFGPPLYEEPRHAWNGLIQGGLAEVMRDAMLRIEAELPDRLLLQIHDSVVVELPKKTASIEAECTRQILIHTYEKAFKIAFDAEAQKWNSKK